ncbi:MAG: hypothetical protein KDC95_12680, partial [Planctomycetes bacterium]|nr:hypothetical protein [Planctomycetota bacterium]
MCSPLSQSRLLWLTFTALCCVLAHASAQGDGAASHARVRIHEIATPIEVDGEALEWTGVEVLHLDRRSQLVATDRIDWDGPEDASALVRLAYDEGHLYLYARIYDRGPLAPKQGETWESGDVLELFFDSDLRDAQAGELAWNDDDLQLMLLPFAPGRPWSFVGRPEKVVARG